LYIGTELIVLEIEGLKFSPDVQEMIQCSQILNLSTKKYTLLKKILKKKKKLNVRFKIGFGLKTPHKN
jgi:hypothetical protein